jgi:hypothetical protein
VAAVFHYSSLTCNEVWLYTLVHPSVGVPFFVRGGIQLNGTLPDEFDPDGCVDCARIEREYSDDLTPVAWQCFCELVEWHVKRQHS